MRSAILSRLMKRLENSEVLTNCKDSSSFWLARIQWFYRGLSTTATNRLRNFTKWVGRVALYREKNPFGGWPGTSAYFGKPGFRIVARFKNPWFQYVKRYALRGILLYVGYHFVMDTNFLSHTRFLLGFVFREVWNWTIDLSIIPAVFRSYRMYLDIPPHFQELFWKACSLWLVLYVALKRGRMIRMDGKRLYLGWYAWSGYRLSGIQGFQPFKHDWEEWEEAKDRAKQYETNGYAGQPRIFRDSYYILMTYGGNREEAAQEIFVCTIYGGHAARAFATRLNGVLDYLRQADLEERWDDDRAHLFSPLRVYVPRWANVRSVVWNGLKGAVLKPVQVIRAFLI